MGHLYSFTGSHSFLSLNSLDYLEDEDYIKVTSNGVEHVEIADPYFKSILNPAYEFQIDNRIVKVTNEFVFAYTKGMQNLMDEFKNAFAEGKVELDFEQELQYNKDLFVFRVAQVKADKGRDNATEKPEILGNKRFVVQQWQENWAFMKTIGVKVEFQQKRNVSGWKNIIAPMLELGWESYTARGIHGYPLNTVPSDYFIDINKATIGRVFEDEGYTAALYGTWVPGVEYRFPHWCIDAPGGKMITRGAVHYDYMFMPNPFERYLYSDNSHWH